MEGRRSSAVAIEGATSGRSALLPREHGAYGELAFPLLAALTRGKPTVAAFALVVAIGAAFFAHEPLLVLLGHRGARAKTTTGAAAKQLLLGLLAVIVVGLGVTLATMPLHLLPLLMVPFVFACVLSPFVFEKRERTANGEALAAITLASTAVPVAGAALVPLTSVFLAFAVWSVALSVATLGVRAVIARAKRGETWAGVVPATLGIIAVGLAVLGARYGCIGYGVSMSLAPIVLFTIGLALRPPPPRALMRVGWALVFASAATTVLVATLV